MPSTKLTQALLAQETAEAILVLVTIDHADLAAPIRVTSDSVDTTSNGDTYQPFPFSIDLPAESDEAPPTVRLRVDNVGREMVDAVRSISSAAEVTVQVVLATTPDTVEAGPYTFTLADVQYDAFVVEGVLTYEPVLSESYPGRTMTPNLLPGLF